MTIGEKIRLKRTELGMTQEELAEKVGFASKSSINKIESGERDVKQSKIAIFASVLHVDIPYLLLDTEPAENSNIGSVFTDNIRMIPVFESVSAGFGARADSSIIEYTPIRIVSDYEAKNTIVIIVSGDSMYPKIEDGDSIQVMLQDDVNDGDIAVVEVYSDDTDDMEAYVKVLIHLEDGYLLRSINPEYQDKTFTGPGANRVKILGRVRKIIKDCE